jgi:catechol 2,3-dioxygenase-like lactoylglutathione lyase family enzyme
MESILDHVSLNVRDFARAKAFYTQALAPLGVTPLMEFGMAAGFGRARPELLLGGATAEFQTDEQRALITPIHVCFRARSRAEVDAFHAAALAAGGRDNGAPGVRAHYHPNYYAAFALDLDGHNVEAVFHE